MVLVGGSRYSGRMSLEKQECRGKLSPGHGKYSSFGHDILDLSKKKKRRSKLHLHATTVIEGLVLNTYP